MIHHCDGGFKPGKYIRGCSASPPVKCILLWCLRFAVRRNSIFREPLPQWHPSKSTNRLSDMCNFGITAYCQEICYCMYKRRFQRVHGGRGCVGIIFVFSDTSVCWGSTTSRTNLAFLVNQGNYERIIKLKILNAFGNRNTIYFRELNFWDRKYP